MSEVILGSQRCSNEKLLQMGFEFGFADLKTALLALYSADFTLSNRTLS